MIVLDGFVLNYQSQKFDQSIIVHADCFEWMGRISQDSVHAIVTDPPYGVKEYNFDQIEKRANGNGGIWRIPVLFAKMSKFTALQLCWLSGSNSLNRIICRFF